MTVEVRAVGVACNLKCTYCYQNPIRDAGNVSANYNLEAIMKEIESVGSHFHLFGGEALLMPTKDLETLWAYGYEKFGHNGVQSNGVLITEEHIELFKKYNVQVGISIDGPNELNDMRWAGSLDKTREATQKIMDNIQLLKNNDITLGIIITLHKLNATKEHLPRLKQFIRWLGNIGVKGGNIHVLEVDHEIVRNMYCLTEEENIEAFLDLAEFFGANSDLSWLPFGDIPKLLDADDSQATCYWKRCDPLNTQAVYGVEGDGALSNCSRSCKEGIDWYKAKDVGGERYISLYHTPPEMGGCQGCRFWSICGGSCPGESDGGDWRNKTMHCGMMKGLLTHYEEKMEAEGRTPITKSYLLPRMEEYMLYMLARGQQVSITDAKAAVEEVFKKPIKVPVYKDGELVVE